MQCTFGIGGETCNGQVGGAGAHFADDAAKVHGDDVQGQPQFVGNVSSQSHIEAGNLGVAILIQSIELVGSVVRGSGNSEVAFTDGLQAVGVFAGACVSGGAACEQGQSQHQCHKGSQ